jgi:hypothetical protein
MIKHYFFFIFKKVLNFCKHIFIDKEEQPPKYIFTLGRRRTPPPSLTRRRKIKVKEENKFEKDKENVLKCMEEFYYVYGTFVNTYGGSMEDIAFAWNYEIWQPIQDIKEYIDTCEPEPPPSPTLSVLSDLSDLSESPSPVRRARRPYRPFQDLPSTSEEDKCKICMTNKKVICFFPCAHIGTCNSCCKNIYKKYFKISNTDNKPYLLDVIPEPPNLNIYDGYENEEDFIHTMIFELSQPRFHRSKKCVFCKEKIKSFKIIYSI